jgi:hypothetical protein
MTIVPAQTVSRSGAMVIEGVNELVTTTDTGADCVAEGWAQASLDVSTQCTWSLFMIVLSEYDGRLDPTFIPFFFH